MSKSKKPQSINQMGFYNLLGPLVLNGVNFFTIPLFTRLLDTAGYGVLTIFLSWASILTIVIGLQTANSIGIAKVRFDENEQKGFRSSILALSFISFFIILICGILFREQLAILLRIGSGLVIILILQSFGSSVIDFVTTSFTYDKQASKTFILSVVTALVQIVLSLVLIYNISELSERYLGRIMGLAIPAIIIGFALALVIMIQGKTLFSKKYWMFCLPICLPIILHGLSGVVLSQTDRIMLIHLTSDDNLVGIFGLAVTLTSLITVGWGALNLTWTPFYYDDMKINDSQAIIKRTKGYMYLFTSLVIAFLLASPEVLKIMAPPAFASAIDYIPFLTVGMYMVFLYSFPVNFQFYHKKTIYIAVGTSATAASNILLNLILIPIFGGMGAAISTMIAYILLFVFHQIIASKVIKEPYDTFGRKQYLLSVIFVFIAVALFYLLFGIPVVRLVISVVAFASAVYRIIKQKSIF